MKKRLLSQNRADLAERGTACPGHFYLSNGARTEVYRLTGERKDDWKKATREYLARAQGLGGRLSIGVGSGALSASMPKHTHSISGSPPFCVGIMATMAGRTIIQRSTASTAKYVGPGCVV